MARLVKLVRDYVADLQGSVVAVEYKPMSEDEYYVQLRRKLIEEATEYALEPSLDELGDVMDVIEALMYHYHGDDWNALDDARQVKQDRRGGFFNGIGMYGATPDR